MLVYISGNTDDLRRGQAAILAALVEINAQADRVTAEERAEWAAREKRLVEKAEAHARELHVNTGLLLALARRYAEDGASDIDSALRGLERALEVAAQRPAGTNLGEEVDAIMAEVDRLNDAGQVAEGGFALKQAMATQRDRNELGKAAMLSLLDKGIAQAVMERSAEDAAACEVERIEIEMLEQTARFDALRSVWQEWYQRGRDKGLNFDLEVSIELAQASTEKARDPGQTGTALNDLGNALWTLGERESGAERLEQAATAYRAALEEWTREKMPLDWAMAQNNLGNVLQTLGERESGTERLEQAVTAFRAALEEGTREKVPLNWATTQNNLGNVFATIGERENDSQRLRQAVTAYRAALEERTRDRVPLEWAVTQNNLGTALKSLGDIEGKRIYAKKAVIAFRAAVEERTREAVPMDWAMTQLNLGGALRTLGESENGTDRLEQAVTAFKAALEELTRERMAIGWAQSQFNLSFLEIAFFRKTGDANHLSRAESYIPGAREVFAETGATQYLAELDVVYNEINHLRNGPSA
ncbi:MAG: tetratricopeptide repeat protein [Rhodobacteraceae bacterium]|nr:tetratricopeptide repeat protein [Paracoccaceae bacterium]